MLCLRRGGERRGHGNRVVVDDIGVLNLPDGRLLDGILRTLGTVEVFEAGTHAILRFRLEGFVRRIVSCRFEGWVVVVGVFGLVHRVGLGCLILALVPGDLRLFSRGP